jgi:transposase
LQSAVWSIHQVSICALLLEYLTTKQIASCHLTHLKNLLTEHSHVKYGREKALEIRTLAEKSIGLNNRYVGFELQQTSYYSESSARNPYP